MKRDYETLDAVAVVGSMVMVSGIIVGLFLVKLDPAVAPIVASLATAILGVPISYGAFRWGNNVGSKAAAEAAADTSKTATGALAQLAGAGAPPPAPPPGTDPAPATVDPGTPQP